MKSSLVVVLSFFFIYTLSGQCNKINFINSSLSYAYNKAQTEDKPIFIFLYEENDPRADFIQSGIFYKVEVCSLFNDKYVNIKARSNSNIGTEIIRQFQINQFPSFIILDKYRNLKQKSHDIGDSMSLINFANRDY